MRREEPLDYRLGALRGNEVRRLGGAPRVHGPDQPSVVGLPYDRLDELALDRVYAALERGFAVGNLVAAAAALRQALSTVAQLGRDLHGPALGRRARGTLDRDPEGRLAAPAPPG